MTEHRASGNSWIQLDSGAKIAFVYGYIEGLFQGHCFSTWELPATDHESESDPHFLVTRSYGFHRRKFFQNVTYQQFVDGLDELYSDFKNRGIILFDGMWIVMNLIAGTPSERMSPMIEQCRRNAVERVE